MTFFGHQKLSWKIENMLSAAAGKYQKSHHMWQGMPLFDRHQFGNFVPIFRQTGGQVLIRAKMLAWQS